jgi:transposase
MDGPQRGAVALPGGGIRPVEQRLQALRPLGRVGRLGAAVPGGGGRARPAEGDGRRHGGAGARLRGQRAQPKGDQAAEGLGRSRGGFSTKLHVLVDALGNPQAFPLLAGQRAREVSADRSYAADATIRSIEQELHATATIPPTARRVQPRPGDDAASKERHLVECFIGKLKSFRRVFSRFDKSARRYIAFVRFASTVIWLK